MVRHRYPLIRRAARVGLKAAVLPKLGVIGLALAGAFVLVAVFALSAILAVLGNGKASADVLATGDLVCGTTPAGRAEIPAELMRIYEEAAAHYQLDETGVFVLAAINDVETDFGRNVKVSSKGAIGWMQFMPATWRAYAVDRDGGGADPNDPDDAIWSAAHYLWASGAKDGDWQRAIFAYNHSDEYVREVQERATAWRGTCTPRLAGPVREVPGRRARIITDGPDKGLAAAPRDAPSAVKAMIAAANEISDKPYEMKHDFPNSVIGPYYDCSSSTSRVLWAGGAFGDQPICSAAFESYGDAGEGEWVTIYARGPCGGEGHVWMKIAGLRFDTNWGVDSEGPNFGEQGPRWRTGAVPDEGRYVARHPPGL